MTEPVDMQATVDRLAVAIGHSVLIEDVDQYPVWWSTVGTVDRTRMRTIVNRHVDPAAAAVIARVQSGRGGRPGSHTDHARGRHVGALVRAYPSRAPVTRLRVGPRP